MTVSRVSEFVRLLAAKGSQTMPVLPTSKGTALTTQRNIAKQPQECQETDSP